MTDVKVTTTEAAITGETVVRSITVFTFSGTVTPAGGDGAVTSVNSQTGDVVLTASDVGALPDSTAIPNSPDDIGAATAAQGGLADTAVQPGDLAAVATSGDYADLTGAPTLGTAAAADTGDFDAAGAAAAAQTASEAYTDAAVAGAGGGGGSSVDTPPASPDTMDDEFTAASLDAKWSWANQGTSTATLINGKLVLSLSSTADQYQGIAQAAPSGNWKFRAKCLTSPNMAASRPQCNTALAYHLTLTGAYKALGPSSLAALGNGSTSPTAATPSASVSVGPGVPYVYVEMEWNGTNIIFRESMSGDTGTFETMWTVSPGSAPGYVGIGGFTYQQPSAGAILRSFEWFRRIA